MRNGGPPRDEIHVLITQRRKELDEPERRRRAWRWALGALLALAAVAALAAGLIWLSTTD